MISRRSAAVGAGAAAALAGTYVGVVAGTAGWAHLADQVRDDWWLLAPLLAGFAVQVALMLELRRRHRLAHSAAISVGAGAGVSAAGMLACCAHHLAELAPLAGATGAATSQLTVDGKAWTSPRWSGDGPSGHHRSGRLSFAAAGPATGTVELRLGGLPKPVTVTWTVQE